ncbi:MAG: hypothetical protein ABIG61_06405 [Planctomycetota bacterium]
MKRFFCVTIDTEPDCDTRWRRSAPLSFDSVLIGIAAILRPVWRRLDIMPVYFVSPEVLDSDACCRVLREEIAFGAEIGAHLHSEYIEPARKYKIVDGTGSTEFPCYAHDSETEFAKIRNLTELIENKLGIKPVSYRAARYGADLDTIKSLEKLGYKVDSSVTPCINWSPMGGPDHSQAPDQPYFVSPDNYYAAGSSSVLEIPITIWKKRFRFPANNWLLFKWLRPTHMTVIEMKRLVQRFIVHYENPVLNMMFHSMEIIPGRTPFVRTYLEQKMYLRRLERIIEHLRKNSFQNKTLEMLYNDIYPQHRRCEDTGPPEKPSEVYVA